MARPFCSNPSTNLGRRNSHPARAALLELAYQRLVPERQSHVVESFEQALTPELIYLEGGREALLIPHHTTFQVNGQAVALDLTGAPHEFRDLLVLERDGEHAVLRAVVL